MRPLVDPLLGVQMEVGSCLKEQRECERSVQALEGRGLCVRVSVCWEDGVRGHGELCPSPCWAGELLGALHCLHQTSPGLQAPSETGIQQDALMPDHFRGVAAEPLLSEPDGAEDWKAKKG